MDLAAGETLSADRLAERKRHGIYYTSELLSDSLSKGGVRADPGRVHSDRRSSNARLHLREQLDARKEQLQGLRIIHLACGSGAFLVSCYQALLEELWRIEDAIHALAGGGNDLLSHSARLNQSKSLRDTLHGVDLLPQAAEIAKLALWLRSARRVEKVPNLSRNIVAADSLNVEQVLKSLGTKLGTFDLVVGNPPWGAKLSEKDRIRAASYLGLHSAQDWDSFELFTALAIAFLKPGGRLALVLPDTFFSPEKAKTREFLLKNRTLERVGDLGPDWFDDVRMGTVIVQLRRGDPPRKHVSLSSPLR